jgi:hypothetical protein
MTGSQECPCFGLDHVVTVANRMKVSRERNGEVVLLNERCISRQTRWLR